MLWYEKIKFEARLRRGLREAKAGHVVHHPPDYYTKLIEKLDEELGEDPEDD